MKRLPFHCPRSLFRVLPLGLGLLMLLASLTLAQEITKKLPEPGKEIQAKKQNIINKMFKEELAAAQQDAAKARELADTLLQQAKQTNDDLALRFVALAAARDLSAQAGDTATALAAIDELAKHYDLNALLMKADMVKLAAEKITSKEDSTALTELALRLLDEAIAEDNYTVGESLVKVAEEAATKAKFVPLFGKVQKHGEELEQAKKAFTRIDKFRKILEAQPDDAQANIEMGRYLCLVKGNWEKGLPMLLKGQDKIYTPLAKRDLAAPKDTSTQLELGDDYASLAENEKGLTQKMLFKRALYWYVKCLPGLQSGLNKVRVDKAIEQISKFFPPASGPLPPSGKAAAINTLIRSFTKVPLNGVSCLAVSPDGKYVLSGSSQNDQTVHLWDFDKGVSIRQLVGHTAVIWGVAFSPDGKTVASCSTDKTMKTWDAATGKLLRTFVGHMDWVRGVFFMPDPKHIVTASDDKRVCIWDLSNGNLVKQMQGHTNYINGFAMTKDGKRAVTGSDDNTVRVWDLTNGQEIAKCFHSAPLWSVAISDDGKKVAAASKIENTVRIWDVDTKVEIRQLKHPAQVVSIALSPDGKVLVTGTEGLVTQLPPEINVGPNPPQFNQADNCLYFWELETGKFLRRLTGHFGSVQALKWTPDGRHVISGSSDSTIRVWGEGKK